METKPDKCTWIGEGEGCEHDALPGRNYCEHHLWQVYQKGTNLRKRHRDIKVADSVWNIEDAFNEAVKELQDEGFDV